MVDQVKSNELSLVAVSPHQPSIPTTDMIVAMTKLTEMAVRSGMAKVRNPADAFFIAMYGLELGIPPMTALRTIYSVQGGAPTCSGEAMLALIRRSGKVRVTISSTEETLKAKRATVHMKRIDSGDEFTATWGETDDQRAGLKSNRDKYPAQMWTWRAVSICSKAIASDIIGGLYTVEEIYPDTILNADGEPEADIIIGTVEKKSSPQSEESPLPDWLATDALKNVNLVITTLKNNKMKPDDIKKFSGITDLTDVSQWAKYGGGKLAAETILAAFNAPPKPKADEEADKVTELMDALDPAALETYLTASYQMIDLAGALELLGVSDWSSFKTDYDARTAIRAAAIKAGEPVIAYSARFMGNFTDFITEIGPIRMGGRDEIRKLDNPSWTTYAESWQKGKTYTFADAKLLPLAISWEMKGKDDKTYKAVMADGLMIHDPEYAF